MEFAIQVAGGQIHHDKTGIEAVIAEAQLAEELGFAVVFVPDHYCFEAMGVLQTTMPTYEMSFVMTSLAHRTKHIRIGSHVACTLFRHPAMLARLFAQIDEASGGRLIAGVGAGWTRAEFAMMGIPFPPISERLQMMDEAVAVMRGLWREPQLSFTGKYYQLDNAVCWPKPVQRPQPPLMLGGSGNGILRRAGEWADIIHMVPQTGAAGTTTLEEIRNFNDGAVADKLARVKRAAEASGRSPDAVRYATTIFRFALTDSPTETERALEPLALLMGAPSDEARRHPVVLIGTAEEMILELRRREGAGLSLLAVNFSSEKEVRAFAEQVMHKI